MTNIKLSKEVYIQNVYQQIIQNEILKTQYTIATKIMK